MPVLQHHGNENFMRKTERNHNREIRREYDFANMQGGVRGKYVRRFREQTNVVVLEPNIAEAFPNEEAVNQALRGVLDTARAVRSRGGLAEKFLRPRNLRRTKSN
jgi:hypothetical protein